MPRSLVRVINQSSFPSGLIAFPMCFSPLGYEYLSIYGTYVCRHISLQVISVLPPRLAC